MAGNGRNDENASVDFFRVLLLGTEAQRREWVGMVQPMASEVWQSLAEIPEDAQPDLVITETGVYSNPEVGIIRIGGQGPANVHLPDEPSVRELHLACRLLAEIVHLRRQQRFALNQQQQWRDAAFADALTGLPNRRAWDKALLHRLRGRETVAGLPPRVIVLAIFDLDDFKQVNEKLGHAAGDAVLKIAGSTILSSMRQGDLVARLGGDEYGLLLTVPLQAAAASALDRARAAVPHALRQAGFLPITASVGFAWAEEGSAFPDPPSFFNAADAALHQAKREGKNRTVEFK
ncbi:MAG: GGDEF domain-containing protein [Pirellulales bacterium]|nr:GGDEF domain-containing protein [Pirellulales bacterium]